MSDWTTVSISKSVGRGGANEPADVAAIVGALRAAQARPMLDDAPEHTAIEQAIVDVQQAFGIGADGRIDPGGTTLGCLNALAGGPDFRGLVPTSIRMGGWEISCGGRLPVARYALYLLVPPVSVASVPDDAITLRRWRQSSTDRWHWSPDAAGLERLLDRIAGLGTWGAPTEAVLLLARDDGAVVRGSPQKSFDCPIEPYEGRLVPDVADRSPKMSYTTLGAAAFFGVPAIANRHYFTYAGKFVFDKQMRGFDCTTYPGSVLGVNAAAPDHPMGGNGETLAQHLEAERVGVEDGAGEEVHAFFAGHGQGVYIVWRWVAATQKGHVVLVIDGTAHEFNTAPRNGYLRRAVAPPQSSPDFDEQRYRLFTGPHWWVRRIPDHRVPAGFH